MDTRLRNYILVGIVGLLFASGGPRVQAEEKTLMAPTGPTSVVQEPVLDTTASPENPVITEPITPINITVSPVTLVLDTAPGTPASAAIKVMNNGAEPENLEVAVATFTADSNGARPVIAPFSPNDPAQFWLSVDEPTFTVVPQQWKTLSVRFSPPPEASLTHYYALIIRRQVEAQAEAGATAVTGAPAILVLTKINSPHLRPELQVVGFRTTRWWYEFLPVEFEVDVKNTGNVHLAPMGNVFIDSQSKKDAGVLSVNQGMGYVLPNTVRTFALKWEDGFPLFTTDDAGKKRLTWDLSKIQNFRFGRYVAHLLLVYDSGERDVPIEGEIVFWVVPVRVIAVLLVAISLMAVGIGLPVWLMVRTWRKR